MRWHFFVVVCQRERRPDEAVPPGLVRWLGHDECSAHDRWFQFYENFAKAVELHNEGVLLTNSLLQELPSLTEEEFRRKLQNDHSSVGILKKITSELLPDPQIAFQCGSFSVWKTVLRGEKGIVRNIGNKRKLFCGEKR